MHQLQQLTWRISKIWGKPAGSVEKYQIDTPLEYPDDKELKLAGNFKADLMLVKLKDEISALVSNAEIEVYLTCQRCLKDFKEKLEVGDFEREFYFKAPETPQDDFDLFLIDTKTMTISLDEMVRQEIILHFPLIPVCSKGCKGLCPVCGKDKNKLDCNCRIEVKLDTHQPFKHLKTIVQTTRKTTKAPKKKK